MGMDTTEYGALCTPCSAQCHCHCCHCWGSHEQFPNRTGSTVQSTVSHKNMQTSKLFVPKHKHMQMQCMTGTISDDSLISLSPSYLVFAVHHSEASSQTPHLAMVRMLGPSGRIGLRSSHILLVVLIILLLTELKTVYSAIHRLGASRGVEVGPIYREGLGRRLLRMSAP